MASVEGSVLLGLFMPSREASAIENAKPEAKIKN